MGLGIMETPRTVLSVLMYDPDHQVLIRVPKYAKDGVRSHIDQCITKSGFLNFPKKRLLF